MTTFRHYGIKRVFDRFAELRVIPLASTYEPRRRMIGEERAYLELSERAALWPGVSGERRRGALHRRMGTPLGEASVLRFGCILKRPPLSIGRMTFIGHYTNIQHATIGNHCLIGDLVLIVDGRRQHRMDRLDVPMTVQGGIVEQVRIGDDCIIGGSATVLADVADHSVVGAGSVVIHPVPAYSIVAGNPARVIGDRRETATTE